MTILSEIVIQNRGKILLAFSIGLTLFLSGSLLRSRLQEANRQAQIIKTAPMPLDSQQDGADANHEKTTDLLDSETSDKIGVAGPVSPNADSSQTRRTSVKVSSNHVPAHPKQLTATPDSLQDQSFKSDSVPLDTSAASQQLIPTPLTSAPSVITVPPGTPVIVCLAEMISSRQNRTGDPFRGRLASPLTVHGVVIAVLGAPVLGRIVDAHQAGILRGHTNVNLELTSLTTAGGRLVSIQTTQWYETGSHGKIAHTALQPTRAAFGVVASTLSGATRAAHSSTSRVPSLAENGEATSQSVTNKSVVEVPAGTTLVFRLRQPLTARIN